jgi:hypothetical protein
MEIRHDQQRSLDESTERLTSDELVKVIRKLRWMGLEAEAERAQHELNARHVATADSVVASPHDTD